MATLRILVSILAIGLTGCGSRPWETMPTTPPAADTPEKLFEEMIQAVNSQEFRKFYGCLTNEARADQIELMIHDLGRGANQARDKSDQSAADISQMLASPQTSLAVIDKYGLPRGKEIQLSDLPKDNFAAFLDDMWHALQSKKKPYIDENAVMQEIQDHGDWACAEVSTVRNRHGDKVSFIYFKKVKGQWRVEMTPWWYPWAREPHLLKDDEKKRLPGK